MTSPDKRSLSNTGVLVVVGRGRKSLPRPIYHRALSKDYVAYRRTDGRLASDLKRRKRTTRERMGQRIQQLFRLHVPSATTLVLESRTFSLPRTGFFSLSRESRCRFSNGILHPHETTFVFLPTQQVARSTRVLFSPSSASANRVLSLSLSLSLSRAHFKICTLNSVKGEA